MELVCVIRHFVPALVNPAQLAMATRSLCLSRVASKELRLLDRTSKGRKLAHVLRILMFFCALIADRSVSSLAVVAVEIR